MANSSILNDRGGGDKEERRGRERRKEKREGVFSNDGRVKECAV